ncbi:MAG TPA: peptide ABC transporter substrate-binding protein, partial [Candidatus Nanopelagicales bacterium]|nr:peptide ABC transporter substrate-binding protein [Candidatus Nanopelagicales bacterium]
YTLEDWKFRYEVVMTRNPHYWDRDRLRIHRVVWTSVEQSHAAMNLYKVGELDYLGDNTSLPAEYMDSLTSRKDFHRAQYLSTYWFEFNVKKPPVDDARVRRALNLAVDKQQIVEKITRGGQTPATHYVPELTGSGYADRQREDAARGADPFAAPELRFDPARGRALLAEAGYPVIEENGGYRAQGFPSLEILYNTHEGHKQIAVAVQDMWRRHLGVTVTLRNEEWKVMLKNVRDGHFQIVRFGWIGEYNHPHSWLATFLTSSPQNRTGWSDPEFDAMVGRAAREPDPRESIRLYREAEARVLAGMPKLPMYFFTKSTLLKPWVKGYFPNARNVQLLKWMWIDPDWQRNQTNEVAAPPFELPPPGRLLAGAAAEARP